MPKYQITGPDGKQFEVTAPDGASEADVLAYAQRSFKMAAVPAAAPARRTKGFGEDLGDAIADVPRQLGLTARYGMEGLGGALNFIAAPVRAGLNEAVSRVKNDGPLEALASLNLPAQLAKRISGQQTAGNLAGQIKGRAPQEAFGEANFSGIADKMGLPQPSTAGERIVGDASRMVAGTMAPMAAGSMMAKNSTGIAQGVGQMLAANPLSQVASGAAAGAAGGYTRETGGDSNAQLVASLAAGVATPFAMAGGARMGQGIRQAMSPRSVDPVQIDITINNAMRGNGLTLEQMSDDVANGIRADVAKAFQTSDQVSPDAVRRLADYRLTGATPTAAGLLRDPGTFTRQKNLAKLGINSKDPAAQRLSLTEEANNRQMMTGLNKLGADTADDAISGGQRIMEGLGKFNDRAKEQIGKLYDNARGTSGRSAALDPHAFTQRASDLLDQGLLGSKLPADVKNLLNKAATGEMPLTVDVAEQLKTRIGDLQRSTMDMSERKALGMVRSALDDTPLLPGQEIGQNAIDAFGAARTMNRKFMKVVEKTPALQAVRDGIEPEKFIEKFIVGTGNKANSMDVAMLKNTIKDSPDALDAVRTQITSFLKQKALNGAADEVGKFSQSGYNNALKQIGDRKLRLFFQPEDIAQLKAIGRVSSYEQVQPVGAAVNNSNTAGTAGAMLLDRFANSSLMSKVPVLGPMIQPAVQNISLGMQAGRSMNVPMTLAGPARQAAPLMRTPGMSMSPALLMDLESEEERQKRLFPPVR